MLLKRSLGFMMVIVLLVGCGKEKQASLETSTGAPRRATTDQTTSNVQLSDVDLWASVVDDLVFIQGQTLYLQPAGQTDLHQLAPAIFPPSLALAPNTHTIVYNEIVSIRSRFLTIANTQTLETQQIYRSSGDFSFLGGISPNGQWAMVFNFPSLYVVKMDGSTTHRIASIQNFGVTPFWLEDNTLLVIIQQNGVTQEVRRFDPVTNENLPIVEQAAASISDTLPITPGVSAFIAFQEIVNQELGVPLQGVIDLTADDLAPIINLVNLNPAVATPEICGTWQVTREMPSLNAQPEIVLTLQDTTFLTANLTLADGSLVFVRWYFEGCDRNKMRAALIKLTPNGETIILTDAIDPGTSPNLGFFFADTGPRIGYSSDNRYAVWIGGGLDMGESSINITNLTDGTTSRLHRVLRDSSNASTFHTDIAYTGVVFVARN